LVTNAEYHREWRRSNPDRVLRYRLKHMPAQREARKRWKKRNPEKVREEHKRYAIRNPDKVKEKAKRYRKNNPDKIRERMRKYYQRNSDKFKEYTKRYQQNNPEKMREIAKKWRNNNHDKAKESVKKWQSNNPDKVRKGQTDRLVKNKKTRMNLIGIFGGACSLCGYNRCSSALEFHHFNRDEKKLYRTSLSKSMVHQSYIVLKELQQYPERFILLCANCHREVESEYRANGEKN